MDYRERIISDYKILLGKPVIKGTRISVEVILKKMAEGASVTDVLNMYPHLMQEDVLAVLNYASDVISHEEVIKVA